MPPSLAQLLVARKLISRERLDRAVEAGRESGRSLVEVLLAEGLVSERGLLQAIAEQQGARFVSLREEAVEDAAVRALTAKFVSHYAVMPLRIRDGVLTLAVSNPFDMAAVEDVETNLGLRVERVLACRSDISDAVRKHYGVGADTVARLLDELPGRPLAEPPAEETPDLEKQADDASVVRLVNQIFSQAIRDRGTDIHFEAYGDGVAVRRRIDGIMHDTPVPANINLLYPAIVSRVKLMSGLDIVERRLPQDGRARARIGGNEYDLRVSVVPTLHGENVVVRILPTSMLLSLEQLGLSPQHLGILQRLIAEPHGIVFLTGPTGSGKTTTLYACLRKLNTRERKIVTIEDPVEYEIRGLTQTQINERVGLTFARALRSMLRHDPDVIMVGEVRDLETAETAIRTALTGHLVLSTLHTNDAASGAVRLMDMGVPPYLVASTVRAFAAQRLVRTLCEHCREPVEAQDGSRQYRGRGCARCAQTGYHGRIAICEFMLLSAEIQQLISARAPAAQIQERAVAAGMRTLSDDGWEKVQRGITTAEEVLRATRF